MNRQRPGSSENALGTLRSAASCFHTALSRLATRAKKPEAVASRIFQKPAPGGPRWGQLVLLDRVGEGAFGEVYRAWDTMLERDVALKLMRTSEENPALLREARLLARLRHSNVVTVYGADRHDGRSGLWMDFIEGETLAAIVDGRGPLGALEALLVGADVCRALAAVHRSGLLHCDIKAQNVMRERGGRIVLMDFGLGYEAAGAAAIDFRGTPLYMAPELFEGRPASVRCDLYAVGVLLFHLVTREYPVKASTIEELRTAHSLRAPQALRDLRPDLPAFFVRVVEKAIAREPSRRYASAGEMAAAIEAAMGRTRFPPTLTRRALWWTAWPVAALAGAAWYEWRNSWTGVKQGASLLLTEISNATGDAQLTAVGDMLRVQLAQSAHFNLLEADRVRETLTRMMKPPDQKLDLPVAREVALRSGTPLLVYGTLSPLGAGYGLSLVIERIEGQPRTPRATESKLFEARNKNGLFDAIHQAATWIRKMAGEAARDISANDTQPEEATTSSWEALEYFSHGERLQEGFHLAEALSMYQRAVDVDPGFALALARIAQALNLSRKSAESFEYWRRAVEALHDRHVTRREELRIRGLYANMTEDYATAEELTHTWALLYAGDSLAHHYRALALRNLGRFEDARLELLTSQRLRPGESTLVNLAAIGLLLGRQQEVASYVKGLRPVSAQYYGGLSKVLMRDFAGAEAAFGSVRPGEDPRLASLANAARACLLAELGRRHESISVLDEGVAQDTAAGSSSFKARKLAGLAHLRRLGGEASLARTMALQSAREDGDTVNLVRAGTVLARAGFSAEARGLLDRVSSHSEGRRFETARAILTAEIALADGRVKEALAACATADKLAPPVHPREFLARAFERAGRLEDSLAAWRRIAENPALIWIPTPDLYDPGAWADAFLHSAELASRLGRPQEARAALDQFLKIREHADPDEPQSVAARKLLSSL